PDLNQIDAARECEADVIELHTGAYSDAKSEDEKLQELLRLETGAVHASMNDQRVNAGHGLNLRNILPIAAIKNLQELHIGHSIVSHAVMVGFDAAVREMIAAIRHGESLSSRYTPEQILK